jgi:hypothetical protein
LTEDEKGIVRATKHKAPSYNSIIYTHLHTPVVESRMRAIVQEVALAKTP